MITLSQSQREVAEALDDLRQPSSPAEVKALLDSRGCVYHLHTVSHCLSALAVHGLCVPRAIPPGHRFVWARTDTPIPRYTRAHVACARIASILAELGPTSAKELARAAKIKPPHVVARAKAVPGVWILRHGWAEPRPVVQDEVKKGALVLCLESQIQDAAAALHAVVNRGGEIIRQRHQALSAEKPPKPAPKPKAEKPPKPAPKPAPCPDAPRVQAPKPAPKPSSDPKPTPPRGGLSRSLLTPDMASVERIERIRAYIAQALPRLRRDGSISHLYLREGQLRHRAHD
jgi:cell division septation protein DedD